MRTFSYLILAAAAVLLLLQLDTDVRREWGTEGLLAAAVFAAVGGFAFYKSTPRRP